MVRYISAKREKGTFVTTIYEEGMTLKQIRKETDRRVQNKYLAWNSTKKQYEWRTIK